MAKIIFRLQSEGPKKPSTLQAMENGHIERKLKLTIGEAKIDLKLKREKHLRWFLITLNLVQAIVIYYLLTK